MNVFKNGLATGLVLQLAIGPVFFFIINLTLRGTILDGLAGALAVTTVDYFYITLAILGIGKLLEQKGIKRLFGVVSSMMLIVFGIMIVKGALDSNVPVALNTHATNVFSSFASVFLLTISSPMTIVFFTSLFAAKALEHRYRRKELFLFGLGTGLATFLFMGTSVLLFSLVRSAVPALLIQTLNAIVGSLLIGYGGMRLMRASRRT